MKNFIKIFPHLVIWIIILIVPMYIMSREGTFDSKPYIGYIIRTGVSAILFYINYLYLIEKFLFKKRIWEYFLINIGLIILLFMLQTAIFQIVMEPMDRHVSRIGRSGGPRMSGPPFIMGFITEYLMTIFLVGLSVAIKTTIRWYRDSINFEKQKRIQLEADLKNLRSQLNPHFLFNTLNNIYSLIAIDQDKAQEAIHRLSHLLRFVMYDNDEKFVLINKEIEFTKNYIDLMKLRLSSNVRFEAKIENPGSQNVIASLMFITLIENAFKHGISNGNDSFININIFVVPDKEVFCSVENSYFEKDKNMESETSGIGLTNLTKRLELLYPNKHKFTVEKDSNKFSTILSIDLT